MNNKKTVIIQFDFNQSKVSEYFLKKTLNDLSEFGFQHTYLDNTPIEKEEETVNIQIEAKIIDRLAKEEIKKTCYDTSLNLHLFTIGFKQAYRYLTGNTIEYKCMKRCSTSNCTCKIKDND